MGEGKPLPRARVRDAGVGAQLAEPVALGHAREARAGRVEHSIAAPAVGPGGYCSPRHRVLFNPTDEGSKCVGRRDEQYLPGPTSQSTPSSSSTPHVMHAPSEVAATAAASAAAAAALPLLLGLGVVAVAGSVIPLPPSPPPADGPHPLGLLLELGSGG